MPDHEVVLTYCNGQNFIHHHETVKEATKEYGEQLAEAIEPTAGPEAKHLRLLTMTVSNRTVDSGVFGCEHRSA